MKLEKSTRALQSAIAYEKNIILGKEIRSEVVEKFIEDIRPFLNKNGTISKRATRSKKARAKFNKIVKDFKKNPYSSQRFRKKLVKKIVETTKRNTGRSEKTIKKSINLFSDSAMRYLIALAEISSDEVMTIAEEKNIDDVLEVARLMEKELKFGVPEEMSLFDGKPPYTQDDIYLAFERALK